MTAGVGHFPKLDLLALQDHRVNTRKGTELAVHLRAAILAGRVRARDAFGRFIVQGSVGDESGGDPSVGDLGLGSVLVPAENATKRKIPAWFFAAPMVTAEPSRDLRPSPTVTNGALTVTRPNPQTQSRGTMADLAAQRVRVRPIGRENFSEDDRFALMDPALSPVSAPLPKGWPGLMLSATDERQQRDLFFPSGGNMLAAVNAGANPETGSIVFDTDGTGALDPTRRARLQSMMRVARIGDGGIAWQLTSSERDALDGYGLTAGRGVLSFPAETKPPATASRGATATGGSGTAGREATPGGTQIGAVTDLRTLQTPARIDGQAGGVVRIDPATGKARPAPGMTVVRGSANDPTTVRTPPADPAKIDTPQAALLSGDLVYAYMGSEKWGPLQVGSADDQHRHGLTIDGEPINGGHLDPRAPFFLDADHDAPLDFELTPYTNPASAPERTKVHIEYDKDATHPWAGGRRKGLFRLVAEGFFRPEIVEPPPIPDPQPPKPKGKEWLVVPGHGIPVTPGTTIATGGQNGFPANGTAINLQPWQGRPVGSLEGEVSKQIAAGWPDADALGTSATGGAGTGVRDGPATGPVRTPTGGGLVLQGPPVGGETTEGQKRACYPKTQSRDKTGMGPVLKRKQYASTSQAVIFGGGTYSRAYATSAGSENLATAVSGQKKRTPSKAEDNAPVVHHEAVIAANPSQDWCRWASTTKRTSTGLATAPGAVVSLPPDVTATSYLAGTPSPGGLTATVAHPPGYSQVAFSDIHPGTGAAVDGVTATGDGTALVVTGKDSDGADVHSVALDGHEGTVRVPTLSGTPTTPAAGTGAFYNNGRTPYFIDDLGTVTALTGGGGGGGGNDQLDWLGWGGGGGGVSPSQAHEEAVRAISEASVSDLADVDTTSTPPTDGQVMTWVAADSQWEPKTPSGGGGGAGYMTGYPGLGGISATPWGLWGGSSLSGSGTPSFSGVNQRVNGATFTGKYGSYLRIGSIPTVGSGFPSALQSISWNSCPLPPSFSAVGTAGLRIRCRIAFLTAGDVFTIQIGLYTLTAANTEDATALATRTGIAAAESFTDLTITAANLATLGLAAGDQIGLYAKVIQTAGSVSHVADFDISGIELDMTG